MTIIRYETTRTTASRRSRWPRLFANKLYPFSIIAFVIFGYLVYINVRVGAPFIFAQENIVAPAYDDSPILKTTVGTKYTINVTKITEALTRSFSAEDGDAIAGGDDRLGFEVSFVNPNNKKSSTSSSSSSSAYCRCDLISIDCLDSISCIPHHSPQNRHALVWIGLETRRAIKATSVFDGNSYSRNTLPLGKQLQYTTIDTWTHWRKHNILPKTYARRKTSIFVNESWYPDCLKKIGTTFTSIPYYNGVSCLYQGAADPEDSTGTILEDDAIRWFNNSSMSTTQRRKTKRNVRKQLEAFLQEHQPHLKEPERTETFQDSSSNDVTADASKNLSPLGNLMLFAHITRMMFNRRPFLDAIYQEKVTSLPGLSSVRGKASKKSSKIQNDGGNDSDNVIGPGDPFIVALHMRRGDSCGEEHPYQQKASPLDSPAQMGSDRMCYQTSVYMDGIRRIRQLVPKTRPLHVYFATDDVGDVIDEILNKKHNNSRNSNSGSNGFVDVEVERWHFLNYSRHHFDYLNFDNDITSIEVEENFMKQPMLGETAVADLWLLSHGHAFVGHLGSRFGKMAWLLATSRHNAFIPFFTVDGHSFCCEIDEPCDKMRPYITVDNCLTFGHEYTRFDHKGGYWNEGSLARKTIFLEQQKKKKKKKSNK